MFIAIYGVYLDPLPRRCGCGCGCTSPAARVAVSEETARFSGYLELLEILKILKILKILEILEILEILDHFGPLRPPAAMLDDATA